MRCIILLWFINLQKDLETLKIVKDKMWEDLSKAHCNLTASSVISSDLANRYRLISYIFFTAVSVMNISAVSDALIDHCHWSDLLIIMKKQDLLFDNAVAWEIYIIMWRHKALNQAVETFLYVWKMKKKIFSKKSFFLTKENRHFNENDNKQNVNVADDCSESFVHDLKSKYTKEQNTVTADSKTCFIISFWWFFIDLLFTNSLRWDFEFSLLNEMSNKINSIFYQHA